jgi:hypothetical protein
MDNRAYREKALREAEAELEAASKPTEVKTAAKKLQRARAELKELEGTLAERPKRRVTRASKAAGGAS